MEPKQATVLSAELTGFSKLSERITVQEFNDLLEKYYEITRSVIPLYKGGLSSFSGEVFTAVFSMDGTLTAPELLAMEAIVELREKISGFRSEHALPDTIHFKAGLSMGEAILGEIGSGETKQVKVMGKAAGHAGRLRDFAEEGQVLADGAVERKARERFTFRKLESLPVRGSKDLLEVYELKDKKRPTLKVEVGGQRKIASKLVGRSQEMDRLEGLLKMLATGKGGIISIVGKAGIGKSRLMAEIKAQPMMEKMLLLEGRAIATGKQLSYHPITNLIRNWAGILEDAQKIACTTCNRNIHRLLFHQNHF